MGPTPHFLSSSPSLALAEQSRASPPPPHTPPPATLAHVAPCPRPHPCPKPAEHHHGRPEPAPHHAAMDSPCPAATVPRHVEAPRPVAAVPRRAGAPSPTGMPPPHATSLPMAGHPCHAAATAPRPVPLRPCPGLLADSYTHAVPSPHLGLTLPCCPPPSASAMAAVPPMPIEPDSPRGALGIPRPPRATAVVGHTTAGPATCSGQPCHCRPRSSASPTPIVRYDSVDVHGSVVGKVAAKDSQLPPTFRGDDSHALGLLEDARPKDSQQLSHRAVQLAIQRFWLIVSGSKVEWETYGGKGALPF
ncbi:classical arabinogalactan protein 9-like [Miscanthus floridulus]|uniref:classical arabinogalactan protein 9-like n=1 Tax=Miscanthus floridulus TaxID=154761 RepID=UPI0034596243